GTFAGSTDVFVTRLTAAGDAVSWSTYLGGSNADEGYGVAVDLAGSAYVTGIARSGFATTAGTYRTALGGSGGNTAFVSKLNSTGDALLYSTFLNNSNATSGLEGRAIAVDPDGFAYVTGKLTVPASFSSTGGVFQTASGGGSTEGFVAKLNTTASNVVWASFLGGSSDDAGYGIAVDAARAVYLTGDTTSSNFPVSASTYDGSYNTNGDAFVAKVKADGTTLTYSTFLGGTGIDTGYAIAVDRSGLAYVTGATTSSDYPTAAGAVQTALAGLKGAFYTRLNAAA